MSILNQIAVTPAVRSLRQGENCFHFPQEPTIHLDDKRFASTATLLADFLQVEQGVEPVIYEAGVETADICFEACAKSDPSAYRLAISKAGILIQASESQGAFYAPRYQLQPLERTKLTCELFPTCFSVVSLGP